MAFLHRLLGGSPGAVLMKLVFLSLLVGAFMSFLDITPAGLIDRAVAMAQALARLGFDAFGEVGQWLLYGAVVVVPIWLVLRLLNGMR